jgi:hypothetical protein
MFYASGSHLLIKEDFDADTCFVALDLVFQLRRAHIVMCLAALDPSSPLRRASVSPRVPHLWTSPPC